MMHVFSDDDVRILRRVVDDVRNRRVNTENRPHEDADEPPAPDVYVAMIPAGGIPARIGLTTRSAVCDVYWKAPGGVLSLMGFTREVFNVGAAPAPGGTPMLVRRDKSGTWWVDAGSAKDLGTLTCVKVADLCTGTNRWFNLPAAWENPVSCCEHPSTGTGTRVGPPPTGCPCQGANICLSALTGIANGACSDCVSVLGVNHTLVWDPTYPAYNTCRWGLDVPFCGGTLRYSLLASRNDDFSQFLFYSLRITKIAAGDTGGVATYYVGLASPWNCASPLQLNVTSISGFWCSKEPDIVHLTKGTCATTSTGTGTGGGAFGLVGWWKLNEGIQDTAFDYSGNGQDTAIFTPPPDWSADTPGSQAGAGGSVRASATSNFFEAVTDAFLPADASARSASFWWKMTNILGVVSVKYATMAAVKHRATFVRKGASTAVFNDGLDDLANAPVVAPLNAWHLYTLTLASDGVTWKFYEDGAQTSSGTLSVALSTGPVSNLNLSLDAVVGEAFIKDARIYSRALSAAEVTKLYNGTLGP